MSELRVRTAIKEDSWKVQRFAKIEEVEIPPNGTIRFRVKVWDAGRDAFITQWFNDPVPALDFVERLHSENEALLD